METDDKSPGKAFAGVWPGLEAGQDCHTAGPPGKTQGHRLASRILGVPQEPGSLWMLVLCFYGGCGAFYLG